jgi:hypothetical protein
MQFFVLRIAQLVKLQSFAMILFNFPSNFYVEK